MMKRKKKEKNQNDYKGARQGEIQEYKERKQI
jgi:hypothetical protein